MDIEGTLSDIHFVKNIMFPYSKEKLPVFLKENENNPKVQALMSETSLAELNDCIEQDIKHPALKKLQGMVWKEAFESGAFQAPLYPDVLPTWKNWTAAGLRLGIYSSGSVTAQKMFFQHTEEGNTLSFLQDHFDLDVGSKKLSSSYQEIAKSLRLEAHEILFLSDIPEELKAAEQAGYRVLHILRPGTEASDFPLAQSLDEVVINT